MCDAFRRPIFRSVCLLCPKVESVTGELFYSEEEVSRWKEAATAEAAAGARMLEEVEIRKKEVIISCADLPSKSLVILFMSVRQDNVSTEINLNWPPFLSLVDDFGSPRC